ncbi:response regulator [Rhodocytophaga aerolata]|uniref:Response regulator n=1 Tax=Rhodocytophaga aerolata TaxID=455078 RepID=A0ABT8QZ56_9BACT|nr:response regulator [Rhodocytophaga aerolata]MDO1444686.1 response regulator [Rhodocytophaga aerolata]
MKKIKNLLVVDDDLVSSFVISSTLEDMAVADKVSTVFNGKQALDFLEQNCIHEKAEEFCPAFILLDLNMPVMDGFEFLEAFGQTFSKYADKITICILSSSSARKDKVKALNYPISGFITKPLTEEKLKPILEII